MDHERNYMPWMGSVYQSSQLRKLELDPQAPIGDKRMKWNIIHEFENLLECKEALAKKMSGVSLKGEYKKGLMISEKSHKEKEALAQGEI
ncbi:hypothetical protein H5410_045905 [Solanum commersonii]|uniref:Uncharacterized protein n=1 Tax=Solanum commersonii TaxID=4109 RepID=A0A9J5XCZ6_SOLCO|nr:hypothetical protein H5410_045905 [Solanum commersonii]